MGGGEVAGGQYGDVALTRLFEAVHFSKGRDIVDARIGARVRHEHQPRIQLHPHAIGHSILAPDILFALALLLDGKADNHALLTAAIGNARYRRGFGIIGASCDADIA